MKKQSLSSIKPLKPLNLMVLVLVFSLLLISCGKKESIKQRPLEKSLEAQPLTDAQLDGPLPEPQEEPQKEPEEETVEKPIEEEKEVIPYKPEVTLVPNTSKLASLRWDGSSTPKLVRENGVEYIYQDITIRNFGEKTATDITIKEEIAPFIHVQGTDPMDCSKTLESDQECIFRLKIKNEIKSAKETLVVSYFNTELMTSIVIDLSHDKIIYNGVSIPEVGGNNNDDNNDDKNSENDNGLISLSIEAVSAQSEEELKSIALPYKFRARETNTQVSLVRVGSSNVQYNLPGASYSERSVKDGMIVFSFLIPSDLDSNLLVEEMNLSLSLKKVFADQYPDTEILCLLGPNYCSGRIYRDQEFAYLINEKFWKSNDQTKNHYFSKVITDYVKKDTGIAISNFNHEFKLHEVLSLKGRRLKDLMIGQKLYFVVADDVRVNSAPQLELNLGK